MEPVAIGSHDPTDSEVLHAWEVTGACAAGHDAGALTADDIGVAMLMGIGELPNCGCAGADVFWDAAGPVEKTTGCCARHGAVGVGPSTLT